MPMGVRLSRRRPYPSSCEDALVDDGEPSSEWTTGRWERADADSFLAWRASGESLSRIQLETLSESISATVRMYLTNVEEAAGIARALPIVLAQCDDLQFASSHEAVAYAIFASG